MTCSHQSNISSFGQTNTASIFVNPTHTHCVYLVNPTSQRPIILSTPQQFAAHNISIGLYVHKYRLRLCQIAAGSDVLSEFMQMLDGSSIGDYPFTTETFPCLGKHVKGWFTNVRAMTRTAPSPSSVRSSKKYMQWPWPWAVSGPCPRRVEPRSVHVQGFNMCE